MDPRGKEWELCQLLTPLPPQESQNLFCCLYRSWCHNPVTTVSLCFLTQNYRHAYDLIQKLYPSRPAAEGQWGGGASAPFPPRWWAQLPHSRAIPLLGLQAS